MRLIITQQDVGEWAAELVAWRMERSKPRPDKPFVLGLPTGGNPIGMYRALVEKYKQGQLNFRHTVTFNMDEYTGIPIEHRDSYHDYIFRYFFGHDLFIGGVSHMWPVSALQMHPKTVIVADHEVVQELKVKTVRYFQSIQDEYSCLERTSFGPLVVS